MDRSTQTHLDSFLDLKQIINANGGQIPISQQALALSQQQNGEDPFPVTNDPKHEPEPQRVGRAFELQQYLTLRMAEVD